ncbi:MAG: hypothetical protein PHI34_02915 [Acidobacteriota bacterium]|nr:hypothetical protein [Acidobacteriota bacterium]
MRSGIRKWLVRSFDMALPERRRRKLERALAGSSRLRAEKGEAAALRRAVAESGAEGFRPGFADRVLARLASSPAAASALETLTQAYRMVFDRFALIAGLVTIALVLINLMSGALLPSREIPYASSLTIARLLKVPLW